MDNYAGEPLNILHTIGLDTLYPTIRCQIKFAGQLDQARFLGALKAVVKIIPSIMCRYEMKDNSWQQVTKDVADLIKWDVTNVDQDAKNYDLMKEPQLRIYWNKNDQQDVLTFYVSHILTDGAGFKQLLYLIAKAYSNGASAINSFENKQDVDWLIKLVQQNHRSTGKQTADHPSAPLELPHLEEGSDTVAQFVGTVQLDTTTVAKLVNKTHQVGVTLNDVFMAVFGKAVQRYGQSDSIALACPTDMRQFIGHSEPDVTRVANHTSRYNFDVASAQDESIDDLIMKIHQTMATKKQSKQCFDSIADLLANYAKYPLSKLQQIVEDNYHVRDIAYTNFGIIDDQRVQFSKTPVDSITLTGSFRRAPMFQIAVATFKGQTTLAFNMDGTKNEYQFGMAITRSMVDLIENFCRR